MSEDDGCPSAHSLREQVLASVETISKIALRSKNLKGTFVKSLKEASASIANAVEQLGERSSSEETRKLAAENNRLRGEVAELRKELADLRVEMRASRPIVVPQPVAEQGPEHSIPLDLEGVTRSILLQVGDMLNARLEGLESRLLPEKRLRPPLAADVRVKAKEKADARQSYAQVSAKEPAPRKRPESQAVPKAGANGVPGASKAAAAAPNKPAGGRKPEPTKKPVKLATAGRAPRLKTPRSSVVVFKLGEEATQRGLTYVRVLREAKSRISLESIGILSLRFRRAMTGARVFEVLGPGSEEKADALADKLRNLFDPGDVVVSRPTKCVALRVSGLDDSTSSGEVVAALAAKGGCSPEQVKAGEVRRNSSGLGTLFLQCPVAAAKKVAEVGSLLVGWVAVKVSVLETRPLICYRCLEKGHVGASCSAQVEVAGLCFRCSRPGHKAAQCTEDPNCGSCAKAGLPARHAVGSTACPVRKLARKGGKR